MTVNSFPDMMAGEDKCLPPWVLPRQDAGLLPCPLITPCAQLATTQSDSSSLFHRTHFERNTFSGKKQEKQTAPGLLVYSVSGTQFFGGQGVEPATPPLPLCYKKGPEPDSSGTHL